MKKALFFFTAILLFTGLSAQVQNGQVYIIKNKQSGLNATTGSTVSQTNGTGDNVKWEFIASGSNYQIKNKQSGLYLINSFGVASVKNTPELWAIETLSNPAGHVQIKHVSTGKYLKSNNNSPGAGGLLVADKLTTDFGYWKLELQSGGSGGSGGGNSGSSPSISSYINNLNYNPQVILNFDPNATGNPIPVGNENTNSSSANGGVILCKTQKYNLSSNVTDVGILQPTGVIYPGALLHANSQLRAGQPQPITSVPRSPLTLSIDLPGISGYGPIVVENPDNASVNMKLDQALTWWKNNNAGGQPANTSMETTIAYSYTQAALDLGLDVNTMSTKFSGSFSLQSTNEKKVTVMVFKQVYFTVNFTPTTPASVFASNATLSQVQSAFSSSSPPAYVQSVKYGRMLVFRMESNNSTLDTDLKAALEYAGAGGTGVNMDLAAKYNQILQNSSIRVMILGGNANAAVQSISGSDLSAFTNYIESGGTYGHANPGSPIVYTVKFLKDNTIAKMGFTTDYETKECEFKPNIWIRWWNNAAFDAEVDVFWKENGVEKSYKSGQRNTTYKSETQLLSPLATDIRVELWCKKGVNWSEITKIFVTDPLEQLNRCYRIYGDVFNPKWEKRDECN